MSRMVGRQVGSAPSATPAVPLARIDQSGVIAEFQRRLAALEAGQKLSVPADRIISMIAVSKDTALIASDKIGLLGEVTFADWHRDLTGVVTDGIDPSITQIRGGVIRTGKVASFDGASYIDLDATGTADFIHAAAVSIKANGNFSFGGTAGGGKRLTWDGSDLRIEGNALVGTGGTTTIADVIIGAADGSDALAGLAVKLDKNAATIMASGFYLKTANYDSGTGIAIYNGGIVGKSGGVAKFTLGADGSATFAGELSAATGSFAGNLDISGAMAFKYGGTSYASAEANTTANAYWLRAASKNIIISSGATTVSIGGPEGTTYIRGTTQVVLSSGTKSFTITPAGYEFSDPSSLVGVALSGHTHSYAPLTGAGTSGSWPISVTGSAASATSLGAGTISTSATCGGKPMSRALFYQTGAGDPGGSGFAATAEAGWMYLQAADGSQVRVPYWG